MLTGISINTVRKYLDRYRTAGDVFIKKSKGARRKLTDSQEQILRTVSSNFYLENLTRIAWREIVDNTNLVAFLVNPMTARYQAVIDCAGNHTN